MKNKKLNSIQSAGFKIPEDYLETFDALLLNKLKNSNPIQETKNSGFKVPEHYFETFDDLLAKAMVSEKEVKVIPLLSWKKLSVSSMPKRWSPLRRNFPLFPNWSANLRGSLSALVRLHRSFPVINNFAPGVWFFSSRITLAPHRNARYAAIIPAGPAPTIARSYVSDSSIVLVHIEVQPRYGCLLFNTIIEKAIHLILYAILQQSFSKEKNV